MHLLLAFLLAASFPELQTAYEQAVDKEEWRTVRGVAEEIAKLRDRRALPFLMKELEFTSDASHRRALFRAIAFAKFPGARDFVEGQLTAGDPYLRATALEAYAKLDAAKARARATNSLALDDDVRVRWTAATVLANDPDPTAFTRLLEGSSALPSIERAAVLRLVKKMKPDRVATARGLLGAADPEHRLMAVLAFASNGDAIFGPDFARVKKDKDARIVLAAAVGTARLDGKSSASKMAALLKRAKSSNDRWELYDMISLAGLRDKGLAQALAKEARSGKKPLRPKAAETLGYAGGGYAVKDLTTILKAEKPWQLPIGAARGLAATRHPSAVPVLIDALEKRLGGRLGFELSAALKSLTGQPFGRNAKVWRKWWSERGTGFQIPEQVRPLWAEETDATDNYSFYGIQLVSRSAVFVCDVSGSMQGKRIETLRRELRAAVKRFPSKGRFNVILFSEKVQPWSKKLVEASPKKKEKLLEFIDGVEAAGATNIWDALALALKDKDVDTVVLLSDGAPTAGKIRSTAEIAVEFSKQNRERMVLLHVVSIDRASPNLRAMARLTGGSYVER
ncbi:MAG: VWA domain-containing protein [Planctomycetota bacterium]